MSYTADKLKLRLTAGPHPVSRTYLSLTAGVTTDELAVKVYEAADGEAEASILICVGTKLEAATGSSKYNTKEEDMTTRSKDSSSGGRVSVMIEEMFTTWYCYHKVDMGGRTEVSIGSSLLFGRSSFGTCTCMLLPAKSLTIPVLTSICSLSRI